MKGISGILNVYFPFELKDYVVMHYIRKIYDEKKKFKSKKCDFHITQTLT